MKAIWAGYDSEGNDYKGHMHICPCKTFIRSDGVAGHYCSAPVYPDGYCSDPLAICKNCGKHLFLADTDECVWAHFDDIDCDDPTPSY